MGCQKATEVLCTRPHQLQHLHRIQLEVAWAVRLHSRNMSQYNSMRSGSSLQRMLRIVCNAGESMASLTCSSSCMSS